MVLLKNIELIIIILLDYYCFWFFLTEMIGRNLFGSPTNVGYQNPVTPVRRFRSKHQLGGFSPQTRDRMNPIAWLDSEKVSGICSPATPELQIQQRNERTCGPCCLLRLFNELKPTKEAIPVGSEEWVNCVKMDDGLKDHEAMVSAAERLGLVEKEYLVKEAGDEDEMQETLYEFISRNGSSIVGVSAPVIGGHFIVVLSVAGSLVRFFDPYHGVEAIWEFFGPGGFYEALVGSDGDDSVEMMAFK